MDQEIIFRLAGSSAQDGIKVLAWEAIASEAQGFKVIQVIGRIQNWLYDCGACVLASCCLWTSLSNSRSSSGHWHIVPSVGTAWLSLFQALGWTSATASWPACRLPCVNQAHSIFSPFSLTLSQLIRDLNYICKIPFSIYRNKIVGMLSQHIHSPTHTWGSNYSGCIHHPVGIKGTS